MNKFVPLTILGLVPLSVPASGSILTSFDVDLSPDTQTFATAPAFSLTLNYAIDGVGNIALDAVALDNGSNPASPARWDQVDNASAGTTAVSALFNTSFALTFSGSETPILNFPSSGYTTGAVLATSEGNASALENGEFVTFAVSGSATAVSGFQLDLVNFSYDNRLSNGQSSFGVEDSAGTVIEQLIPNTSSSGTISGTGISLAAGEAMTFRTIAGNVGGAGLSGFEFTVTAVPEPSTLAVYLGAIALCVVFWRRRRQR